MNILFLAPYPAGESPSQRFRLEHYLPRLAKHGHTYAYKTFIDMATWKVFFSKGNTAKKIWGLFKGFLRRWVLMLSIGRYDMVYIHREAAPMGPPIFEWIIAKIWRKKIVYDFDDSIWVPTSSEFNRLAKYVKWFSKISSICKWSYCVTPGNEFLADYASRFNNNVVIIPTVVDTDTVHNRLQRQGTDAPVVGWTGTFSTIKYLDALMPAFKKIAAQRPFQFLVICDKDPKLDLPGYRFKRWNKQTEAEDLLEMHIGLMPLNNSDLAKGKCGFKAIQYMALGIPAIVSPVGVNTRIVTDGSDGFIAEEDQEWVEKIQYLLDSIDARVKMGEAARQKIVNHYSVNATEELFMSQFR